MRLLPRRKNQGAEDGPQLTSVVELAARPPRPRDSERTTRRKLDLWDRVKYLVLLATLFAMISIRRVSASRPLAQILTPGIKEISDILILRYLVPEIAFRNVENF